MLLKNILWDSSGRVVGLISNLIVTGVLSRLLPPESYGVMAILMAVNGLASIFSDFGFGAAIIQRGKVTEAQLSTIFYINLALGLLLYAICTALSSLIADIYNDTSIKEYLLFSCLVLISSPLALVPSALVQKNLLFKEIAIRNIGINLVTGTLAIVLAYYGFGIWSLIFQNLSSAFLTTILTFKIAGWLPKWHFQWKETKVMFDYGFYLFLSGLLNNLFSKIDVFLIGKVFNMSVLGQYGRAQSFDSMVRGLSTSSLISVLFPYFAQKKEKTDELIVEFYHYFGLTCLLFSFLTGLAYISSEVVFDSLFGANWNISAEYYRILAIASIAYPLSALALSLLEALGHSKKFFEVEILKKVCMIPTFILAYFFGVHYFLYALVGFYIIALFLNLYYLKKAIDISLKSCSIILIKNTVLLSLLIFTLKIMSFMSLVSTRNWLTVIILIVIYTLFFALYIHLFEKNTLSLILTMLKKLKKHDSSKQTIPS